MHHDCNDTGPDTGIGVRRAIYLGQLSFALRNGLKAHAARDRALRYTADSMSGGRDLRREWDEAGVIWGRGAK